RGPSVFRPTPLDSRFRGNDGHIPQTPARIDTGCSFFLTRKGVRLAGGALAPACGESTGRGDVVVCRFRRPPAIAPLGNLDAQDAVADRGGDFGASKNAPPFLAHPQSERRCLLEADTSNVIGGVDSREQPEIGHGPSLLADARSDGDVEDTGSSAQAV